MTILNERFKLPSDIVIKNEGSKFLFLNPSAPDWIVTNSNGAAALKLCNGKRTLTNIINRLSKLTGRDTSEELLKFFEEVLKSNLFLSAKSEKPDFRPYNLHTIHLNLTNKCNLKCLYCYADERIDSKDTLQFQDYLYIIDSINHLCKNAEIVLTGGEPLLSIYALNIAEYAKNQGNQIHILTNGTLINELNVNQISEISDLIKVSLDGNTPGINDSLRGKGSFHKIIKAIDLLLKHNAPLKISMTVTKKNINNIESMAKTFGSLLTFAPLFHAGRAKSNRELEITGKEYYNALTSAKGINPLSDLCSSLDRARKQKIMKCAIGDAEISISANGDVYPCHLLHIPKFLAGNVKEQNLESIYRTSDKLRECRKLNVFEIKGCNKCDIRFICGGACRSRAFFEKGKINVSDAFCEYEKSAFINGLFNLHQLD